MSNEESRNMKILLADDDASMRRFLEITLQRAGFDVTSAEDGLSAMRVALAEHFDLVIADAVMPNLTGHDLCRLLRENPNYKTIPLFILSGLEQEISEKTEENCADIYLVKSADLKEVLLEQINKFTA